VLSDHAAAQVRHYRELRGWRRVDLAERCTLSASVLENIETGRPDATGRRRRQVSVDELLILAAALEVSPVQLLIPLGTAEKVEAIPNVTLPVDIAAKWVADAAWASPGAPVVTVEAREHLSFFQRHAWLVGLLTDHHSGSLSPADRRARCTDLVLLRQEMAHRGLVLPRLDLPEADLAALDEIRGDLTRTPQPRFVSAMPEWIEDENDA